MEMFALIVLGTLISLGIFDDILKKFKQREEKDVKKVEKQRK